MNPHEPDAAMHGPDSEVASDKAWRMGQHAKGGNRVVAVVSRLFLAITLSVWAAVASAQGVPSTPSLVPIETGTKVEFVAKVPNGKSVRDEAVNGVLFMPSGQGRKPGAVIINSSGGVQPHTELFWGRLLAANGIAALVVDSFVSRNVRRTSDDQSRMTQSQSDADAVAAFRVLAARADVDRDRILVMGMSKGGATALNNALPGHMAWLGARDVVFAAHIALTPGGCVIQYRDVATTNRPILFMMADMDDLTPTSQCLTLAERMRKAGNKQVERVIYPAVYHAMEWTGGLEFDSLAETYKGCDGFFEPDGSQTFTFTTPPTHMTGDARPWLRQTCVTRGAHIGGDYVIKQHLVDDMLGFLRRHDFIRDPEVDAVLGDCDRIADVQARLLCGRGRAGIVGDIVALGRAFAHGDGVTRDEAQAARLFRLAATRGSPHGAFELAQFLRDGRGGLTQDRAESLRLLRFAAEQDYAPATLLLGVAYRDGIGVERDDAEASLLFRRAALNRNPWAMADLGRFYRTGRGGLPRDPAEALRLFRLSALQDNPWGQYNLAGMLEQGEGVPADRRLALELYRKSEAVDWAGKKDATQAVRRLETSLR